MILGGIRNNCGDLLTCTQFYERALIQDCFHEIVLFRSSFFLDIRCNETSLKGFRLDSRRDLLWLKRLVHISQLLLLEALCSSQNRTLIDGACVRRCDSKLCGNTLLLIIANVPGQSPNWAS